MGFQIVDALNGQLLWAGEVISQGNGLMVVFFW